MGYFNRMGAAAAVTKELVEKMNPNHDPHSGKFTSGKGKGGGAAAPLTYGNLTQAEKDRSLLRDKTHAATMASDMAAGFSAGASDSTTWQEKAASNYAYKAAQAEKFIHADRGQMADHHERAAMYHGQASKDQTLHEKVRQMHGQAEKFHKDAAHHWSNL